jgi:hypothetical protein
VAVGSPMNKDAIRKAGGIRALVALLPHGVSSAGAKAAEHAAGALRNLAKTEGGAHQWNCAAIQEAGGIPALASLLMLEESRSAEHAIATLGSLAHHDLENVDEMLDVMTSHGLWQACPPLMKKVLQQAADTRLQLAQGSSNEAELRSTLDVALAAGLL